MCITCTSTTCVNLIKYQSCNFDTEYHNTNFNKPIRKYDTKHYDMIC